LQRFLSNDSAAIDRGDVGSAFQRSLDSPKGIVGVRKRSVDPGGELCDRSARNQTFDPPNRTFCFGEPSRDVSRQLMESTVGNEPFRAGKCFLNLPQPLFDAGGDGLKRCHRFDVRP
jgi:hypothetical protein